MIGIYKIENIENGKFYIGQSVNLIKRIREHKNVKDKGSLIDKDIELLGVDNFDFSILEECERTELDDKEKFYIEKYNSCIPFGYNQTKGGSGRGHFVAINQEILNNIIDDLKNTDMLIIDIARYYGVHSNTVTSINTGKTWHNDNISYPIRRTLSALCANREYQKEKFYCSVCGKEISGQGKTNMCPDCYRLSSRTVERPSKEEYMKMVYEIGFQGIANKYNLTESGIRKWTKDYNLPPHKEDIVKLYSKEVLGIEIKEKTKKEVLEIYQCDIKTHKIIDKFSSIKEIKDKTGLAGSHITEVCKGTRKSSEGYFWCYVKDYKGEI